VLELLDLAHLRDHTHRHISGISQAHLRHISGISQAYLAHVHMHIFGLSRAYLAHREVNGLGYLGWQKPLQLGCRARVRGWVKARARARV
jgi:hypothetical protein